MSKFNGDRYHVIGEDTVEQIVARYYDYCNNMVFTSRGEVNRRLIHEYNFKLWKEFFVTLFSYVIFTYIRESKEDLDTTHGALLDTLDFALTSKTQFCVRGMSIVDAIADFQYDIRVYQKHITIRRMYDDIERLSDAYFQACSQITSGS